MYEFEHFDGADFTTFNIIENDSNRMQITVAVSYIGKISVVTYDLYQDENGLYFEYGPLYSKIYIGKFTFMEAN